MIGNNEVKDSRGVRLLSEISLYDVYRVDTRVQVMFKGRFCLECGGKHSAPHRGRLRRPLVATALKPLLIFSARGTRLEGGNREVQKCDSVDPLRLVIKCLGGRGHELGDSIVRTFGKQPSPPGDQVNTHTHIVTLHWSS